MRLHIALDDELVAELNRRLQPRERSRFIAEAIRMALEDIERWELIESSLGTIRDGGHAWDEDPAAWVRGQRRADARRVG